MNNDKSFRVWVLSILGGIGFLLWSYMAFNAPAMENTDYGKFVIAIVGGIVALVLRDMQPPGGGNPPAAPGSQTAPAP